MTLLVQLLYVNSVQSSLVQTSTTGCATSDIQASPTRSPVSSVSLTEIFISTGSQIHSSTEPCSSSSVHSAMIQSQVHQPPIFCKSEDSFHPDIGNIYVDCKQNSRNFCTSIQSLSAAEKYALFKKHNKPPEDHAFPCTLFGKYNRRFQFKWLDMYPWIVYSTVVEGVFCIFCALFCDNRDAMGCFVNEPCFSWNKFHEKCKMLIMTST